MKQSVKPKGKVLIISYLFPPIAGGGVPRPLKMCKYLPEYGWKPVVLTVDPEYNVSLDESLLKQIPEGTPVYRAREWNPYQTLNRLRTSAISSEGKGNLADGGVPVPKAKNRIIPRIKTGIFNLLKKMKSYIFIPDDHVFWVPFAVRKGLKAIRDEQVDAIFSTSGPYSCHLVAKKLAKKTGLPWIADFRDPWTQNMHRSGIPWRERLEERMERSVMKEADVITTVTHSFADNFRSKFPELKRIEVIHNGYDPEDYAEIDGEREKGRLTFAYTGIFYRERNPRKFLQAIAQLIEEKRINRDEIRIRFAGVFDYPGYTENQDAVRELRLDDVVEVLGYLPHRESLILLKSSDILLLIGDTAPGSEAYIPGKLYEYLAVKRPILSFSLPGEATRIIERFSIGKVVPPTDLVAMKEAIMEFVTAWREGRLDQQFSFDLSTEELSIYQRDVQAGQLANLLDQLKKS